LAGLVFAATPIVFLQVGTAYVDIAAAATVLATWQLLLSAHDQRHGYRAERGLLVRHFLVAGLGLGMMIGTKSSNLLAAVLAAAVAVVVLRRIWRVPTSGSTENDPTEGGDPGPVSPAAPTADGPEPGAAGRGGGGDIRVPDSPSGAPARSDGTLVISAPAPVLVAVPEAAPVTVSEPGLVTVSEAAPVTVPEQVPPARFGRWAAVPLWALVAPAVLVGGFWYVRNLMTYGNPLWPITIPFFQGQGTVAELIMGGDNVPAELADQPPLTQIVQSWATDLFVHPFVYDQRLGGFGPQWLLLLVPAIAVMVLGFLRDRVAYLLGLLVPFAVLLLLQPASWWSRYTIFVVGLGAVCYPLAAQWLAGRWERALHLALIVLVGLGMWWSVSPTYLGSSQAGPLSPVEAVALLRADETTRMTTRPPWDGYTALADGPKHALVAIPDRNKLLFTHPYVGTDLDRRLVVIATPETADALHTSARRIEADYVVLDPDLAPTDRLARDARRPGSGFREVGRTYEGLLFAVE
ncbi:MAG TPA: hypothetical protein VGR21_07925, partial [Cryptosporangiaceae bacterium]|nr:hypothetical protein [Cryptosporangiaceae bacterium]